MRIPLITARREAKAAELERARQAFIKLREHYRRAI